MFNLLLRNKPNPIHKPQSPPVSKSYPIFSTSGNLKQPPSTSAPIGWIFTIVSLIVIIFILLVVFISRNSLTNDQTRTPTLTRRSTNTQIPSLTYVPTTVPSHTPTSILSNCKFWSSLTNSDVGNSLCVYGRVVKIYSTDQYRQIIRFSNNAGTFLIWDQNDFYGVSVDNCLAAIGIIHQNASSLYMYISGTTFYEYSGCP
jgi:hypothetical protein